MSHHQELATEKYWNETVQKEIAALKREKNKNAIRAFAQFIAALAFILLMAVGVQQIPNWLPALTAFVEQSGIAEAYHAWVN